MKGKRHWMPYVVVLVLVLVLYFGADVIARVRELNSLTEPWPVAGSLMVAGMLWLLWVILIEPVYSFSRLACGASSTRNRAQAALKELGRYSRCENDPDPGKQELFRLWRSIYVAMRNTPDELPGLLREYAEKSGLHRRSMRYIYSCCRAAGLGVVISRNKFMDGIVLLVLQMKMLVTLARMHGYKPSPVFNVLCFSWAVANSLTFALLGGSAVEAAGAGLEDGVIEPALDALSDNIIDPVVDFAKEQVGMEVAAAAGSMVPIVGSLLSMGGKMVFEAVLGALPVYVTGRVFLSRLEREAAQVDVKTLVSLRREGLKSLKEIWLGRDA